MNVEKIIRTLGYIVYTVLWTPVIVLLVIILPFVWMIMCKSIIGGCKLYWYALKAGVRHDVEFIKTGVWG